MPLVTKIESLNKAPVYSRKRPIGRCWKREDGTYGAEVLTKHDSGSFAFIPQFGMVEAPPPLPSIETSRDAETVSSSMLTKHDSGSFAFISQSGMVEPPPPLPSIEKSEDDETVTSSMLTKHDSGSFAFIPQLGMVEPPPPLPSIEKSKDDETVSSSTEENGVDDEQRTMEIILELAGGLSATELMRCTCRNCSNETKLRSTENYVSELQSQMKTVSSRLTRTLDMSGRRISFRIWKGKSISGGRLSCAQLQSWNGHGEETVTTKWLAQDGAHDFYEFIRMRTGNMPVELLEEAARCSDCNGYVFVTTMNV